MRMFCGARGSLAGKHLGLACTGIIDHRLGSHQRALATGCVGLCRWQRCPKGEGGRTARRGRDASYLELGGSMGLS
jgi:hypothetical protein